AVLLRPVQPGPAPLVELPLPAAPEGDLLRRILGLAIVRRPPAFGQVGDQPVVDLSPEGLLRGRGTEIHRLTWSRKRGARVKARESLQTLPRYPPRPPYPLVMVPKIPCEPLLGPAVKYSVVDGPARPSLPNESAHRPSILTGLPLAIRRGPCGFQCPFDFRTEAFIFPLPKFPTSQSPLTLPNADGAIAKPHGASSAPLVATRPSRFPPVSNMSTKPSPAPGTSNRFAVSCFA